MFAQVKINNLCKVVSEFALEYRTTREKVIQQREKKDRNRERRKTRGKMIVNFDCFEIDEKMQNCVLIRLIRLILLQMQVTAQLMAVNLVSTNLIMVT